MEDWKLATVLELVYIASHHKASQILSTRTQKKHLCRLTKEMPTQQAEQKAARLPAICLPEKRKRREGMLQRKVHKLHRVAVSTSECISNFRVLDEQKEGLKEGD